MRQFPPEYKEIHDTEGYHYAYMYRRPSMTTDSILIRKDSNGTPYVLLICRGGEPYKGCWAFPGGFLEMNETLEACAARELMEETGLSVPNRTLVGIYDAVDRDPRGRVITAAYLSYYDGPMEAATAGDDAAEAQWWPLHDTPQLAFDQQLMLNDVRQLLQYQSQI